MENLSFFLPFLSEAYWNLKILVEKAPTFKKQS